MERMFGVMKVSAFALLSLAYIRRAALLPLLYERVGFPS